MSPLDSDRPCEAPGCHNRAYRKLHHCNMHHQRLIVHGDLAGGAPILPKLPAAPLLELIELRGGIFECSPTPADRRVFNRARASGAITVWNADRVSHSLLGLHPAEVWDDDWWNISEMSDSNAEYDLGTASGN